MSRPIADTLPRQSMFRRAWRTLKISLRRPVMPRGPRRVWLLIVGLVSISAWQLTFSANSAALDATYRNLAASGMHDDARFVYFLHYLDLFPVATIGPEPALNEAAARALLTERPDTLVQDLNWTWFEGDRGKIYLYMLDAWLKGAPVDPSVKPFNRLAFTVALCGLFFSFWWLRQPLLGALTVLFVGSDPFQLFEVHANENVHGWTITIAILVLALHLPALTRQRLDRRYLWLLPAATGLLLATSRTVRSEPVSVIAAAVVAYLSLHRLPWRSRGLMVAALIVSFMIGNAAWNRWFLYKHEQAKALLARVGGHPFPGPIRANHAVWHPLWCGLGDFGQKYGYEWHDNAAVAFAFPTLVRDYGQKVPLNTWGPGLAPEEYWDAAQKYKKLPFDTPHYADVLRRKILRDITRDPIWFAGVLARRAWRLVTTTTPVRVSLGAGWWTLPMHGLLLVPLSALLLAARSRFLLGLLLFSLSTCIPALLVFSGRGMTYYAIYHLLVAAILLTLGIENLRWWAGRRRRRNQQR